jgi:hypothetical protein
MTALEDAPAVSAPVTAGAPTTEDQARALATQWANEQAARLTEQVQNYMAKKNGQSNGEVSPRIGGPTTYDPFGNPYVAFDVVATSPITVAGPQLYPPSKIIAAGSLSFLVAFIWANPMSDSAAGWAVPANIQLGGLPWRMTVDLTDLTNGGVQNLALASTFPGPPQPITPVVFLLPTPDPGMGNDPSLMEANVTVYVDFPAKPYAAFATNFWDVDNDPGFPFAPYFPILPTVPPETAGYRYDLPNRYLIYS